MVLCETLRNTWRDAESADLGRWMYELKVGVASSDCRGR